MRFLSYLSMLLLAVSLTACGGGGGSAGASSGAVPLALTTTAPGSLTVAVGASQTFTINGGRAPYAASSSNIQVAAVGVRDATFTIGGIAPGSSSVTVTDADAKIATIAVTVGNLLPLATNAPPALTLPQGTKRSYTISGGVPGYSVESSDARFVNATVLGSTLTINAIAIGTTPISVLVRDAAGTVLTIAVTVSSSSTLDVFTTAPAALSVAPQSTTTFTIGGGTPPYSVVSNNTSAAIASVNGTVLTITAFTPSTTGAGNAATITVRDANSKVAEPIVVTVTALPFVLSASDIKSFVGDVLDVTIFGGTPPYRVFSSNDVGVSATLLPSGTAFRLTLNKVSSSIDVTVFDANNQQQKVTVTAQAGSAGLGLAPSSVTVSENDNQDITFTVLGAAPGTLSVFSSNSKLHASIEGNIVTVRTGTSRCVDVDTTVNIDVIDSKGAKGTATVIITDNPGAGGCPDPVVTPTTT